MVDRDELRKVGPSHPEWNAAWCGKKLPNGLYCTKWKTRRPDGSRRDYCSHHFRGKVNADTKRVINGGSSYVLREEVAAKFNVIRSGTNLLDLQDEIALFRAYLSQGVENLNLADKPKDFMLESEWIFDKVERLTNLIVMVVKVRNDTALTVAEIQYLQQGIATILKKYLPEDVLRGAVEELFALTAVTPQVRMKCDDVFEDGKIVKGEDPIDPKFRYIRSVIGDDA